MTAGTSRIKNKFFQAGKEINVAVTEQVSIDVGDNSFEMLTNDQGDVFIEPASVVSSKLVNPFVVKRANFSAHVLN